MDDRVATLIKKFSHFLIVDQGQAFQTKGWLADRDLVRSMEHLLNADPDWQERELAYYWLQNTLAPKPHPLAPQHLAAYLDHTCYWVVRRLKDQGVLVNQEPIDVLQQARSLLARPQTLFAHYDANRSQLSTYAQWRLRDQLLQHLRRGGQGLDKYSDWKLLCLLTPSRLNRAMDLWGSNSLSYYPLILSCYQEVFQPTAPGSPLAPPNPPNPKGGQPLSPPTPQQLQQMVNRYQQRCGEFDLAPELTVAELNRALDTMVKAVRYQLRTKPATASSLDALATPDVVPFATWNRQAWQDSQAEWDQINEILVDQFNQFCLDNRRLLILWQGFRFPQQELCRLAGYAKQYQLSRAMKRWAKALIKPLITHLNQDDSQANLRVNPQFINQIATTVYIWIENHCRRYYHGFLQAQLLHQYPQQLNLLKLHYGAQLPLEKVAQGLGILPHDVQDQLQTTEAQLQQSLKDYLEQSLEIDWQQFSNVQKRLLSFVQDFLAQAPYGEFGPRVL